MEAPKNACRICGATRPDVIVEIVPFGDNRMHYHAENRPQVGICCGWFVTPPPEGLFYLDTPSIEGPLVIKALRNLQGEQYASH